MQAEDSNPTFWPKLFIGRQDSLEEFSARLKSAREPLKLLVATGLPGMGCRTYLEHACQNLLGCRLEPMIPTDENFSLETLHAGLFQKIKGLDHFFKPTQQPVPFEQMSVHEQMERIAELVETLWSSGRIPCLVDDDNYLVDQDGGYRPPYADFLRFFLGRKTEAKLAIVHRRRPNIETLGRSERILMQKLPALSSDDTRFLLRQILKTSGMMPDPEQVEDMLPALSGRPFSAYAAMRVIDSGTLLPKDYARPTLLKVEAPLLLKSLQKMKFSDEDWSLLRILAGGESWSLDELAAASGESTNEIAASLQVLVDNSVVETDQGRFHLSAQVREAVFLGMDVPSIDQRFFARKKGLAL